MNKNGRRGQALVLALMVLLVLGAVGMAGSVRAVNEGLLARRYVAEAKAFWFAEAGLQKAYWDITRNDCRSMKQLVGPSVSLLTCSSCKACSIGDKILRGELDEGIYTVTSDALFEKLVSVGTYAPDHRAPLAVRRIQAELSPTALFAFAAFSKGAIYLSQNARIDSYDSSKGKYGEENIGNAGNIGTNSDTVGSVKLESGAEINGNVTTGEGGTVEGANYALISGNVSSAKSIILPPVVIPYELVSLESMGSLNIFNNQTKVLEGGLYKYGTIKMENNGKLVIDGDVRMQLTGDPSLLTGNHNELIVNEGASLKIYVDGKMTFENNIAVNNLSGQPGSFVIYSLYAGKEGVVIAHNDDFTGEIYAPDTDVVITNEASVSGAVVGKTVTITNKGEIHYDQSLGGYTDKEASPILLNWREIGL